MAKVMIINAVWSTFVCGMLTVSVLLYQGHIEPSQQFGPQVAMISQN